MRVLSPVVLLLAAVYASTSVFAQQKPAAGASLVYTEGEVYLNDRSLDPKTPSGVLPDIALLRTSEGRAAIALKRGGFLFLNAGSSLRVLGNGVYNFNRIEMLAGSAIVASGGSAPLVECESDIRLSDGGIFRFDIQQITSPSERSCKFRVFEGAAAVPLITVTNALRAGQTMMCNRRCGDMIPTSEFSREQLDDFDQWARRMHERLRKPQFP